MQGVVFTFFTFLARNPLTAAGKTLEGISFVGWSDPCGLLATRNREWEASLDGATKNIQKSSLSMSNFADFLALDIVRGYFDSSLLSPSCRTTRTMRRTNSGLPWIRRREPPHPNPVLPPVCKAEFLFPGAGMTAAMMFWRTSVPVRILSHFSPRGCSLVTQRHPAWLCV